MKSTRLKALNVVLLPTLMVAFVVAGVLSSCSSDPGRKDYNYQVPSTTTTVMSDVVPGLYGEVYTQCDHGNRLYLSSAAGALGVVANDPSCSEGSTQSTPTVVTTTEFP